MSRKESREHAFKILFEQEFAPQSSEDEVSAMIGLYLDNFPEKEISAKDRSFIEKEVKGTVAHQEELDKAIASQLHGWKIERLAKVDLAIMRLALYEMMYDPSIPDGVSINEAVELAKNYGLESSGAFVNGVLANFAEKSAGGQETQA